jgi:hypothetical protein
MLIEWIEKYPACFEHFPELVTLKPRIAGSLCSMLDLAEEQGFFSEAMPQGLQQLLSIANDNADDMEPVSGLVQSLITLNSLTSVSLHAIKAKSSDEIWQWQCALEKLVDCSEAKHYSIVKIILSHPEPEQCAELLQAIFKAGRVREEALSWLERIPQMRGVGSAIELYQLSERNFPPSDLERFSVLAQVFIEPLSVTIFNKRFDVGGMYSEREEKLSQAEAEELIARLCSLATDERLACFYNFMAKRRGMHASLKGFSASQMGEVDDFDLDDEDEPTEDRSYASRFVDDVLEDYIETSLQDSQAIAQLQQVQTMIETLKGTGGDKALFKQLWLKIANAMEFRNEFASWTFEVLKDEIWQDFQKPRTRLADFSGAISDLKTQLLSSVPASSQIVSVSDTLGQMLFGATQPATTDGSLKVDQPAQNGVSI